MRLEFGRPAFIYLLALLPLWWLVVWPRVGWGVLFARGEAARHLRGWLGVRGAVTLTLPRLLRFAAMACLVLALADPRWVELVKDISMPGKGIALAVDVSSSMLAFDMEGGRNRLEVAREAAIGFAKGRPHDELSLVGFAGQAVTRVPPTTDLNLIVQGVQTLKVDLVRDGTYISQAVLTAVARLLQSDREPRVVVLLTDGAHNGDGVPPVAAARVAEAFGVRVHAISILPPEFRAAAVAREMETVLAAISGITGGHYFHASSGRGLRSIYRAINRIEMPKPKVIEREVRHSLRNLVLLAGLLLLGMDVVLRGSRWGVVP